MQQKVQACIACMGSALRQFNASAAVINLILLLLYVQRSYYVFLFVNVWGFNNGL